MKKYLIEGKYTKGQHEGKTFLLTKGGYVAGEYIFASDCYDTKKVAQMVATKKNKQAEFYAVHCKSIDPCEYTVKEIEFKGGDGSEGV